MVCAAKVDIPVNQCLEVYLPASPSIYEVIDLPFGGHFREQHVTASIHIWLCLVHLTISLTLCKGGHLCIHLIC